MIGKIYGPCHKALVGMLGKRLENESKSAKDAGTWLKDQESVGTGGSQAGKTV
jgi:hypothetical protein